MQMAILNVLDHLGQQLLLRIRLRACKPVGGQTISETEIETAPHCCKPRKQAQARSELLILPFTQPDSFHRVHDSHTQGHSLRPSPPTQPEPSKLQVLKNQEGGGDAHRLHGHSTVGDHRATCVQAHDMFSILLCIL